MPKLWNETIDAHRRDARDAILDTAVALVAEHGLRPMTSARGSKPCWRPTRRSCAA